MAAARAASKSKKGGQPKTPCLNRGICGNTKNHIVGTFTQKRCEEITKRRAAGEVITAENVMNIRPPGMERSSGGADEARDRMKELRGIADAWKNSPQSALDFVRWSQGFTDYSPFNRLMIRLQNPDATQVAGRRKWEQMGREVNEDAKGVEIFVPAGRPSVPKLDEDGNPVLDKDGKPVMERRFVSRFRSAKVFDISETTGDTPPEVETEVLSPEALQALVKELEADYMLFPSTEVMASDVPARIRDGRVAYNAATQDENQQMVNRLVAAGMAVSMRLRAGDEERMSEDSDKRWGQSEHMYAGVAAAWNIGQEAGVDLTDLAILQMSDYSGRQDVSTLATHGVKVADHVQKVRDGMPAVLADVL